MQPLHIIRDKQQAAALLQGNREQLLQMLREPASASALARKLEIPRQKVNYHLRELEKVGLIHLVEERKARNCLERIVQATARVYLVSPEVLAGLGDDPQARRDQFSSAYLLTLAGKTIRELGALREAADAVGKTLATLSLEADIRFASAADRNAFAEELAAATAKLIAKYHNEQAADGRVFRMLSGLYPAPTETQADQQTEHSEEGES